MSYAALRYIASATDIASSAGIMIRLRLFISLFAIGIAPFYNAIWFVPSRSISADSRLPFSILMTDARSIHFAHEL